MTALAIDVDVIASNRIDVSVMSALAVVRYSRHSKHLEHAVTRATLCYIANFGP